MHALVWYVQYCNWKELRLTAARSADTPRILTIRLNMFILLNWVQLRLSVIRNCTAQILFVWIVCVPGMDEISNDDDVRGKKMNIGFLHVDWNWWGVGGFKMWEPYHPTTRPCLVDAFPQPPSVFFISKQFDAEWRWIERFKNNLRYLILTNSIETSNPSRPLSFPYPKEIK